MSYPAASDFYSRNPQAAWWIVHTSAGYQILETTGYSFTRIVQGILKAASGVLPTWDGTIEPSKVIVVDGKWGPLTLKALWAVVPDYVRHGLVNSRLPERSIEDDARERIISRVTLGAAIWVYHKVVLNHELERDELFLSQQPPLVSPPFEALPLKPVGWTTATSRVRVGDPTPELPESGSIMDLMSFSLPPAPPALHATVEEDPGLDPADTTHDIGEIDITRNVFHPPATTKKAPENDLGVKIFFAVALLAGVGAVTYALMRKDPHEHLKTR